MAKPDSGSERTPFSFFTRLLRGPATRQCGNSSWFLKLGGRASQWTMALHFIMWVPNEIGRMFICVRDSVMHLRLDGMNTKRIACFMFDSFKQISDQPSNERMEYFWWIIVILYFHILALYLKALQVALIPVHPGDSFANSSFGFVM